MENNNFEQVYEKARKKAIANAIFDTIPSVLMAFVTIMCAWVTFKIWWAILMTAVVIFWLYNVYVHYKNLRTLIEIQHTTIDIGRNLIASISDNAEESEDDIDDAE